jgi:predicted Fe-S protein YdhL (DUF1289 family)
MAEAMTRPTRPMSPCLSICTLDEANICMGCLRTLAEIKGWATLSGSEQWTIVGELAERQAGRKTSEY